jgi:hypothetical protein
MNYLKSGIFALAGLVAATGMMFASPKALAANTGPAFNIYNGVDGVGSESDFLRIGTDGSGGNNIEACQDGQIVDFWMYVHNGASEYNNGANLEGVSVAHNTVLGFAVDNADYTNSHTLSATIKSNETSAISDTATITCGGQKVALEYVGVSGFNTTDTSGLYGINGDPINGASIGRAGGVVPGCWNYRARVNVQVRIKVQPKPVVKECVASVFAAFTRVNRTTFDFTARANVDNAVVTSFIFTAKDKNGAVVDTKTVTTSANNASYRFAKDVAGDYTVSVVINTDKGVATGDCAKTVTVTEVPTTPVYTCEGIVVAKIGDAKNRAVRVSVNTVAEPTNRVSVGTFVVNYGDGKADTSSADNTYAKDGTYNVVLKSLNFTVDGKTVTLSGDALAKCSVSITVSNVDTCPLDASKPNDANCVACPYNGTILIGSANCVKPRLLPQTGAGSSIGVFILASMVGMFGYRSFAARKQ